MEYYSLTTPQQNIWNLQKYYDDTAISNLCGAVFYREKRDGERLRQAIVQFIKNQSGLRLRFREGNVPVQYVAEAADESIPEYKFASREEFDGFAEKFARKPVGLTDGVMYRFAVFQTKDESGILVVLSHLIADAWTFGLMAKQLDEAYRNPEGEETYLLQADYRDFIAAEKQYAASERYQKDKAYWDEKYAVHSGKNMRPEESPVKLCSASSGSIAAERITKELPISLEQKMAEFCRERRVTPAVLFETAIIIYLSKINRENHTITIGVPVLNRCNAKEKRIAGMFVSTMPLTVSVTEEMSVVGLAGQIARGHMEIFRHQKYPYADILRALRENQNFSGNLYDVMVSYQNAKTDTAADTKWYSNGCSEVPLTVHIDNRDGRDSHTINVDYQTDVFGADEVQYLLERLEFILEQVTADADRSIRDICIVPEQELKIVTEKFNDTYADYPRDKCVHELFAEQAARTPEKVALVFEEKKFTYRQLDEMSNSLAQFLREKGVKQNDVVPIIAKRSWHVVVAMLGILKAGGAYMPVSPDYPEERIRYMLAEAKCRTALLYGFDKADMLQKQSAECVELEVFDFDKRTAAVSNVNKPEDLCYVIYTSGSTGRPKGVSVCHQNVVNYCSNNSKCNNVFYNIAQKGYESIVSVTNVVFDIFVTETLMPLLNGITVYFANEKESMHQSSFAELICKNKIDVMQTTPTRMRSYIIDKGNVKYLQNFKAIILGGEALTEDLYRELRRYTAAQIFNLYGPAETTVWSTNAEITSTPITIGHPIANTQIYILDANLSPLPVGVAGELCIAGDGVGKGYLNRPELTAERFLPNPFATEENRHGKVLYRTGDLARWRADGEIEYLGRIDTQVKIRGLRIELGEIESVLAEIPGVQLAAAAEKRDADGRQYLVGYYTAEKELDEQELRRCLAAKLPKYMVPNYFMHLSEMPMTASGKTDRKNLPEPGFALQTTEYIPPETETERKLAEIWQRLLKIEKVGKTDDFFALGGDSLLAIAMISEIEKNFRIESSVREIMEHSVLAGLAQRLENACAAMKRDAWEGSVPEQSVSGQIAQRRITPEQSPFWRAGRYLLLPQQKAIYAACMKEPDTLVYNMPAKISLPDAIDRDKLKQSIVRVLERHKILKSCICAEGAELYGIYKKDAEFVIENHKNGEEAAFVRPFDLEKAPLVRVGFTENALLFDIHHIIADGESVNILLREIASVYAGDELGEPKVQYADYATHFWSSDREKHRAYFKEMSGCGWEPVALPQTGRQETGGSSKLYTVPEEIFVRAKAYARKNGLTDTMVLFGAYGLLLSKYTGQKEILSGIILRNRMHADTENMVGMFVNTLPAPLVIADDMSEYMQTVKQRLLDLFCYQELPFVEIAEAAGISDKSVLNTAFVYQGDGEKALTLEGHRLVPQPIDTHTAKFDLTMELTPTKDGCILRFEYSAGKYAEPLIDSLADSYLQILEQLDRKKTAKISALSERELRRVVEEFNDTYVDYPREKCVHELFAEQVARTLEKVALVFEEKKYTYRQLDEMSNSLAQFLRERGVKQGDRVAVLLKRDERVILAQLAVLKLGAVFVPVDSRYPRERVEYILSESNAKILLRNRDNGMSFPVACCLEEWKPLPVEKINPVSVSADDVCYIIFTSGSTGQPKGCMLTNRGLVNFCRNNNILEKCNRLVEQICVSVNTISFDFFIAESLLPLLNGYTVVLANEAESVNQKLFSELVTRNRVNIIQTTPTRYRLYFSGQENLIWGRQIKVIVTSGESLPVDLLKCFVENTDADIFNPLGPSECSVWATGGELHLDGGETSPITIGRPIANTQIYILDANLSPVPVGVQGELCIAGDGVGKGYLSRPELTAERFLPNPFSTEKNRHGKVLYRTGDLARWTTDGEIEYLGRIDTQVKIRGLRIELGEIESVLAEIPGVQLAAVTDKKDEDGRQYLVGYYTAAEELDEKELRRHLAAKLPKYMIPNYFMYLSEMPMTASGKTDRKNLPEPDFVPQTTECIPPETEPEKELCRLVEEILHVERVGVTDDFFALGGDSLTAITYLAKAHDAGIDFALQNVFDYPTVRGLCAYMEQGIPGERLRREAAEFEQYQGLFEKNVIDDAFVPEKRTLGNVLLTGATGFLGAHVLDALLREETGKIYCLVRDGADTDGRRRLWDMLQYYFENRYDGEWEVRILPVAGDVEREGLADGMPKDVQTVIHTAASVKHYGSYAYFHRVNVEGTRHVIDYAKSVGARLIHISTLSVSGNSLADAFEVYRSEEEKQFDETSLYIGQPLDNVYVRSKFEAECAVYDAALAGLDAKVIRVGNLTNRARDFKFQPNYTQNAFVTRVKAILEFGLFPDYLMPLYTEFSPIDLTAEGVVRIAQYADRQTVFHLNSNRPIYFDRFLAVVRELGIPMEVVEGAAFYQALRKTIRDDVTEYIFEALENDLDGQGRLVYDSNIRIGNDFTVWFLNKTGFEWPETDMEYISGYLAYFRKLGYLEV